MLPKRTLLLRRRPDLLVDPVGLVVADGRLYRFGMDAVLHEVVLPNTGGPVTAVGAALDGHRIAVVAGGGLYVASLAREGASVTVGRARRLVTTPRDISVVEWSGEGTLVLSGRREPDADAREAIAAIEAEISALDPADRGEGRRTYVHVDGLTEPVVASRSDENASDVTVPASRLAFCQKEPVSLSSKSR